MPSGYEVGFWKHFDRMGFRKSDSQDIITHITRLNGLFDQLAAFIFLNVLYFFIHNMSINMVYQSITVFLRDSWPPDVFLLTCVATYPIRLFSHELLSFGDFFPLTNLLERDGSKWFKMIQKALKRTQKCVFLELASGSEYSRPGYETSCRLHLVFESSHRPLVHQQTCIYFCALTLCSWAARSKACASPSVLEAVLLLLSFCVCLTDAPSPSITSHL